MSRDIGYCMEKSVMKLESINIRRFRSIEAIELKDCDRFNVLIGKNNSGKSNILSAIDAFFHCIHNGSIVSLDPPIGKLIDFFERTVEFPIEVILCFLLQPDEKESLIQSIITEAPQMKNAIEGIVQSTMLAITTSIINVSHPRSYVSKITLKDSALTERNILSISKEAALELCSQQIDLRRLSRDSEKLSLMLRRMDAEDWRRFTREISAIERETPSIRTIIRRIAPIAEVGGDLLQRLEAAIVEPTYEEFSRATKALIDTMQEDIMPMREKRLKNKIDTFAGIESSIPKYVTNLLQKVSEVKVLYLKEQRKQIGKEEAERLLSLKVQRGGPKVLRNIQETIAALLGVQVDAFQGNLSSSISRNEPTAELDVDNFLVEVNGSGIREALSLVLDYEFKHPNILLIEEPEIHLHPALETSMMRYLKNISLDCQVFVTTHSTNFIDTAEMKNVYLVSKSSSTQVQLLDFEEAETQIPKELGIRLSSLFMFDRLVFVEGPSDAAIIREWASTLRVNLSQLNVGFITMGGARNFSHYAQRDVLSFLTKRRVKLLFLLDRDEREDTEIARLENALGDKASVKILKKREIENYLLCPRAVVEFIRLKKELASFGNGSDILVPTEAEVKRLIDEYAEKLKQITIDKQVARLTCRPVHPSLLLSFDDVQEIPITQKVIDENRCMIKRLEEVIGKVEEIYREKTVLVNNMWQSSKLDLVPGDHLLDLVCRHYNVRYKKELDGSRLAALMAENEIDWEIKEIIQIMGKGVPYSGN
jgi:putative ATP-dependent endonuclease of the OLD family